MAMTVHESVVDLHATTTSNVVTVEVRGKLTKEDYEVFVPTLERAIEEHGKVRLLFVMNDFHGWEASALWEDVKFDAKHWNDLERVAMVGDKAWEKGMAVFCKPFTTAKVKYFDIDALDAAREWIQA